MIDSVRPLLFLTGRSIVNGIKRQISTPRRIISFLFVVGYYVFVFIRPFGSGARPIPSTLSGEISKTTLPNLATFEPYFFLGFVLLGTMLSLGILSYKGVFRPADVDVLFPTPVNPKVVLLFRILRDYIFTLLLPLFCAIIGFRGTTQGLDVFFRNFPKYGPYALRAATGAWFLLALAWVAIGYAASLFVNRTDLQSERNRRIIIALVAVPPLLLAVVLAIEMRASFTLQTFHDTLANPLFHILFPTSAAASAITMAPLTGNLLGGFAGLLFLIATSAVFLWLASSQSGWMYDQAAARGFDDVSIKALQRKGDMAGVQAAMARKGRVKVGRVAARISRWQVKGPLALIWKEAVLQARTSMAFIYLFVPLGLIMMGLVTYAAADEKDPIFYQSMFWMFGTMFTFIMIQISSQMGFVEVLRRVDLQKPLPFSPNVTMAGEVVGKAGQTLLFLVPYSLGALILKPSIWLDALMAVPLLFSVALVMSSSALLVTILFPDVDDPTQRGFRGLMQMLGTALTLFLGVAVFLLILIFQKSPLGGLISIPINLGMVALLTYVAGTLYATFNPSE